MQQSPDLTSMSPQEKIMGGGKERKNEKKKKIQQQKKTPNQKLQKSGRDPVNSAGSEIQLRLMQIRQVRCIWSFAEEQSDCK